MSKNLFDIRASIYRMIIYFSLGVVSSLLYEFVLLLLSFFSNELVYCSIHEDYFIKKDAEKTQTHHFFSFQVISKLILNFLVVGAVMALLLIFKKHRIKYGYMYSFSLLVSILRTFLFCKVYIKLPTIVQSEIVYYIADTVHIYFVFYSFMEDRYSYSANHNKLWYRLTISYFFYQLIYLAIVSKETHFNIPVRFAILSILFFLLEYSDYNSNKNRSIYWIILQTGYIFFVKNDIVFSIFVIYVLMVTYLDILPNLHKAVLPFSSPKHTISVDYHANANSPKDLSFFVENENKLVNRTNKSTVTPRTLEQTNQNENIHIWRNKTTSEDPDKLLLYNVQNSPKEMKWNSQKSFTEKQAKTTTTLNPKKYPKSLKTKKEPETLDELNQVLDEGDPVFSQIFLSLKEMH